MISSILSAIAPEQAAHFFASAASVEVAQQAATVVAAGLYEAQVDQVSLAGLLSETTPQKLAAVVRGIPPPIWNHVLSRFSPSDNLPTRNRMMESAAMYLGIQLLLALFPFSLSTPPIGEMRFPRLEALHTLLRGTSDASSVRVVDNGSGSDLNLGLVLAAAGYTVWDKEPGGIAITRQVTLKMHAPKILQEKIHPVPRDEIDQVHPSQLVFWSNPDELIQWPQEQSLESYMGRDVEAGGYLVIQTDHLPYPYIDPRRFYLHLAMSSKIWERVFDNDIDDCIIPTAQRGSLMHLQIWRRKS
ncbi:MAG: hypothetical protein Q7T03_01705 [Deltaproteobacteria bacterium]|nr:hypothetical protein [Deltaproteobacteria bacterium]